MHRWSLILLAVFALPAYIGAAGDAPLDRATMKGLKSVGIVIDKLDEELEAQGLTQESLQSRINGKLQRAGIVIDATAAEFVGIRMMQVRGGRGPYALCISLGLYQPVLLVRDHNARTATQTWEVETVLMSEPKLLRAASLNSVDELADRFVAAYQGVNGGKP